VQLVEIYILFVFLCRIGIQCSVHYDETRGGSAAPTSDLIRTSVTVTAEHADLRPSSPSGSNDRVTTDIELENEFDAQPVTVMKTGKGKLSLGYLGYTYRYNRCGANSDIFLRCIVKGCVGRIKSNQDHTQIEVRNSKHNHPPSPDDIVVCEVTCHMRERASTLTETVPAIYRECTAKLANSPSAAALLPTLHTVDSALYYQRRRVMPPLPKSREDITVPDMYQTKSSNEQFLAHCSRNNDLIMFCTPSSLKLLCESNHISMDGTFDCVPALFSQLLTIHAFEHGKLLPLAYCLLSSKERSAYAQVFRTLKEKAQQENLVFAPSTIMSDFEGGLIASVRDEFPNAVHHGCYFHFTQAIWRQVQHLGLVKQYTAEERIRQPIRQLMALGFLPLSVIHVTFRQLKAAAPPSVHPLFAYFEQQWLGNVPIKMWNVHNVDIRTNNDCEGWHNRFNRLVDKHHPNVWHLLHCIREEQASTDVTRCQIRAGKIVSRQIRKYKVMQKSIETIRTRYDAGTIDVISYLDGISYNLKA